jgi:hypothetical protein
MASKRFASLAGTITVMMFTGMTSVACNKASVGARLAYVQSERGILDDLCRKGGAVKRQSVVSLGNGRATQAASETIPSRITYNQAIDTGSFPRETYPGSGSAEQPYYVPSELQD